VPPGTVVVLSQDAAWMALLEKETTLSQRLANGVPFAVAGFQLFVAKTTAYSGGRVYYECVAVTGGS